MDEDEGDVQVDTVDLPAGHAHAAAQNLSEEICDTNIIEIQELGMDVPTMAFEPLDFYVHRPNEPPRKRIRSVGSVIAHTATAVTIGAVITWSALAFS